MQTIVNTANASLYSIRHQCTVFNVDGRRLSDGRSNTLSDSDLPFVSLTEERDDFGRPTFNSDKDHEEEVILRQDFFGKVLTDMGLKRYVEIPEETQKMDNCL